ncbi:NAD(P)-dependent oxidoreductase [Lacticaseibacillus absianus]|uniref:NAD(P)-dependent oxidoreductase n=1 Tax=Lacticaseibacillus absianus TaxID=2729623 RepID=UPI0015C9C32F|nr:NAD(P)-dependent oxidoreductase [Lacticaseibacillus absianus]
MSQIVVLNGDVVNFDGQVDWTRLGPDVAVYGQTAPAEVVARAAGAQVLVTKEMPMPGALVRQLPASVELIVEAGTGYNNHDRAALAERGIALANVPAYSTDRVAQTAVMMMLALASSLQTQVTMLAHGDHRNFDAHLMVPHVELNGKTLGVIGFGHIGQAVIKIAQAMGMRILVSTRTPRVDRDGIHFTSQADLLANSDVVSLHLPLTPATHHLIDSAALAQMKPSALLINTARGGLVDTVALVAALQAHRLAGAGLDVQEQEPLPATSPLWALPNVLLTPHIGWKGAETRQRLVQIVADDIHGFLSGQPLNLV